MHPGAPAWLTVMSVPATRACTSTAIFCVAGLKLRKLNIHPVRRDAGHGFAVGRVAGAAGRAEVEVEGLGHPGAGGAGRVGHFDLGELAARLPAPGHGLDVQRLGGGGVVAVVQREGHAHRQLHADVAAGGHGALDRGVGCGGAARAGAGAVLQVDQGQAVAARSHVPVVVGAERERHLAAVRLEQLDVGDVEAEVLDLRIDAAAAQARDGGTAGHRRAAGVGGEVERDRLRAVVTAAAAGNERRGGDGGKGEGPGDGGSWSWCSPLGWRW